MRRYSKKRPDGRSGYDPRPWPRIHAEITRETCGKSPSRLGQMVAEGDEICILESMKMEISGSHRSNPAWSENCT